MTRSLSDAKVIRIRKKAAEGKMTYADIGEHYDCHHATIAQIARGNIYKDVGGPRTVRRPRNKKKATAAARNGRPQAPDLASLSIDDAARLLQALAMEWPKIKASFELLDRIFMGQHDAE